MNKLLLLLPLLVTTLLLASCHSNERNYKAAYDKAIERRQTGIEAETYAKIATERERNNYIINGDSVRLMRFHTLVVDDSASVSKPYGVVVASFKQRINAISYRDRLRKEEHFASYVLRGGEQGVHYVVVQGFDTATQAAEFLQNIDQLVKIKILEPKPWIYERM